jgi:hypothetical protein
VKLHRIEPEESGGFYGSEIAADNCINGRIFRKATKRGSYCQPKRKTTNVGSPA